MSHPKQAHHAMTARISKPAKNAMQSGTAKTKDWQLDYEPEQPRVIEPLMGWTSSGDMKQQVTLRFHSKEEAVAYCEREGIAYQVIDIEDDPNAADIVMAVNGGNQTVPTIVFPDGSALTNPSLAQIKQQLAA